MALIHWWKLDGNTNDSVGGKHGTLSATPPTIVNGKIGQCYEFTNNNYILTNETIDHSGDISMSVWVYPTDFSTAITGDAIKGILSNHNHSQNANFTMFTSTNGSLKVQMGYTDETRSAGIDGSNLILNTWQHICFTYNHGSKRCRIYINGVLDAEKILTKTVKFLPAKFVIGNWAPSYLNQYEFVGKIDDVRVYDHELSAKEVKELSKAKILHYTFDDFQEPTVNLLTTGLTEKTGGNEYLMYANLAPIFDTNGVGKYTFSFDLKVATPGSVSVYCTDRVNDQIKYVFTGTSFAASTTYQRFTMTVNVTLNNASATHTSLAFYGTYGTGVTPSVKNVQIEKKDYATPFVVNNREGVIKDGSGYENHAVLTMANTPKWVLDSKLGEGCYEFDKTKTRVAITQNGNPTDQLTLCAWVKPRSYTSDRANIIQKDMNYYLTISSSGQLSSYWYDTSYPGYHTTTEVIPLNSWSFIASAWDGSYVRLYINGAMVKQVAVTTPGHVNDAELRIGSENIGGRQFDGWIDDPRIYATALSTEDILELYQSRAQLDDKGNLYVHSIQPKRDIIGSNYISSTQQWGAWNYIGDKIVRFSNATGSSPYNVVNIPIKPNTFYTFKINTRKFGNGTVASFYIRDNTNKGTTLSDIPVTDQWSEHVVTLKTAATATHLIRASIQMSGADSTTVLEIADWELKDQSFEIDEKGIVLTDTISEVGGPTDGLISWLPLNGNYKELVKCNDGIKTGALTQVTGLNNNAAINFVSGSMVRSNGALTGVYAAQKFSFGCWCKPDSTAHRILMSALNKLELNAAGNGFYASVSDGVFKSTPAFAYAPGTWYHVFATHDGVNLNLYVNGIFVSTITTNGFGDCGNDLLIGNWSALNQSYLGAIADVRVYNRALSADEVTQLYNETKQGDQLTISSGRITIKGMLTVV